MKGKSYSKTHVIPRSSGLKPVARSLGYRSHSAVARQVMRNPKTTAACLQDLEKDIQKELTRVASVRKGSSCLRLKTLDAMESFSWEKLNKELKSTAPSLHRVLQACVNVQRRQRVTERARKTHRPSDSAVISVCAALLLRHRNHNLNLLQRIIFLILHSGHAAKQVQLFIMVMVEVSSVWLGLGVV